MPPPQETRAGRNDKRILQTEWREESLVLAQQVKQHADGGACTPRQIASACKAGTDCGSCVRRIQAILGRGACPRRDLADQGRPVLTNLEDAA